MDWTVMGIFIGLFVLLGFWYVKMEHHTRKIKIVIFILLILLLYFSVASVFTSEDLDLKSPRGIVRAGYVYFGWIGSTLSNLWDVGAETTGRVVEAVKLNESDAKDSFR